MSTFHGIWTGALIVLFLMLVAWAWSDARKPDFDEASRLPLEDDGVEGGSAS
jgi:cbb3-type cytochrome oxidase subunit 3